MKRAQWWLVAATAALALLGVSPNAAAKRTGMNLACHNCHEGQDKPKVSALLSTARLEAGQAVTITVTAMHPRAKVGGVLVDSKGLGAFEVIDAVGTRLFEGTTTQATHAAPQPYLNGQVQFSFRWVAPAMVGTVELEAWSNAGNDNLMPHDDSASEAITAVSVGCDAAWYYLDADKDGSGAEKTRVYSCEPVVDRILQGGDCDDQNPLANASVTEICNSVDDNCDGSVDEGFVPVLLVTDADGDGFGARSGMSMIGCPPQPGFAEGFDDCNDADAAVNPAALELANGRDDNCNGKLDEAGPVTGENPSPAPPEPSGCSLRPRDAAQDARSLTLGLLLMLVWARRKTRH